MKQENRKINSVPCSTLIELSPQDSPISLNSCLSETDWNALIDYKGNQTKATAWLESRLQEVSTLNHETKISYLRVMLKNVI